jgi:hypothetical protein
MTLKDKHEIERGILQTTPCLSRSIFRTFLFRILFICGTVSSIFISGVSNACFDAVSGRLKSLIGPEDSVLQADLTPQPAAPYLRRQSPKQASGNMTRIDSISLLLGGAQ